MGAVLRAIIVSCTLGLVLAATLTTNVPARSYGPQSGAGGGLRFGPQAGLSFGPPAYTGPCYIITCAEAHSVTRAMTEGYTGNLFQLVRASDSATLDVGQTA